MICPGCSQEMSPQSFDGHYGKPVALDLCHSCSALWFDGLESIELAPGAVLRLFVVMNDNRPAQRNPLGNNLACPQCHARLVLTADMQRSTRFSYWRCPSEHGHFITFFEFLREKNFVRPLSAREIDQLKQNVRTVTCSSCGAPVDLQTGSVCPYCRAPLSMLDARQVDTVVRELKREEAERGEAKQGVVDPALSVGPTQNRGADLDLLHFDGSDSGGLVEAGVAALAALLKRV